jgi:hypothetical protein
VSPLHITNGDAAGEKLRTFVDGPVTLAADVLHEGPARATDDDAWYAQRGAFLAGPGSGTPEQVAAQLREWDRAMDEWHGEVVLWFEHDLFDQLALIRTLDRLARRKPTPTGADAGFIRPVSLICIDRFPGLDRFIGLGQLTPGQLATLYPGRVAVTGEQFTLASEAWSAFRAPDPRGLLAVARAARALPFLAAALFRFLAEYPSTHSGLSRTEELALAVLADASGPIDAGSLFAATQRREPSPFMGDTTFFDILRALATVPVPLVAIDAAADPAEPRRHRIAITDAGRAVLDGREDHVRVNGIDRWRGGVHLEGTDRSAWRWDARRESLVS